MSKKDIEAIRLEYTHTLGATISMGVDKGLGSLEWHRLVGKCEGLWLALLCVDSKNAGPRPSREWISNKSEQLQSAPH